MGAGYIMKTCTKCKIGKLETEFHKDRSRIDGLDASCKDCKAIRKNRQYWSNRDSYLAKCKIYDKENREQRIEYGKLYALKNPEKLKATRAKASKKWQSKNRDHIRQYERNRLKNNLPLRLSKRISTDINDCLSGRKDGRHWEDLVGYTKEQLKTHLESQFEPGMSWDNWGRGVNCWHIDHIRPQSWFDFTDSLQLRKCWALSNLTCKWEPDNLTKSNKYEG